jgi:hypothetical protein
MAPGQQARHREADLVLLAQDDAADLGNYIIDLLLHELRVCHIQRVSSRVGHGSALKITI